MHCMDRFLAVSVYMRYLLLSEKANFVWSQGLVPRTVHAENGNYNLEGNVPGTSLFDYFNQCNWGCD